jgi:2'-5' RNA ligase
MYYALVVYPEIESGAVDRLRARYDPTAGLIAPHITVLFPIPGRVDRDRLLDHLAGPLRHEPAFSVRCRGTRLSPDHWLFLNVVDGRVPLRRMYRSFYSDLLDEFRRDDLEYHPGIGIGHFARNPHDVAAAEAETSQVSVSAPVDALHLVEIPDSAIDWLMGERPDLPDDAKVTTLERLALGQ